MTERRLSIGWRLLANLTARPFSRIVLCVTMWMTWRVTAWAFEFANNTAAVTGYDTAATLLAVTGPFAALQAAAFKVYTEWKRE